MGENDQDILSGDAIIEVNRVLNTIFARRLCGEISLFADVVLGKLRADESARLGVHFATVQQDQLRVERALEVLIPIL